MNKQLITFVLLATFSLGTHAKENFYKWVDDRGVTHYSQSPPDENSKTKTKTETISVSTRLPVGSEAAVAKRVETLEEKAKTESKEGVKKTGAKQAPDTSKAPAQYKEECAQYKKDAQDLADKGNRLSVKDEKGEIHRLTDEEIAKRLAKTEMQIKTFCGGKM